MSILKHNKLEQFYKYVTPQTALKIIEGQRLRWSSPTLFNDPFDHQSAFAWDFSGDDFYAELGKWIEHVVYDLEHYKPAVQTSLSMMVSIMRQRRPPREKFSEFTAEMASQFQEYFEQNTVKLNAEVLSFLLDSKVLCLSSVHDNVVMWAHYAHSHMGAVFKLRRLTHLDHRFLVAQPVEYTDIPARYASVREYARHLVGLEPFDPALRIWRLAYRKHVDWSYEREWRIHVPLMGSGQAPWFYDEIEPQELFESIYLGCRVDDDFLRAVLAARNAHLPSVEVFRAVAIGPSMQLHFEKIT